MTEEKERNSDSVSASPKAAAKEQPSGGANSASPKAAAKEQPSGDARAAVRKDRGRGMRVGPLGTAHIRATFNNTMMSITDAKGDVVSWSSAGRAGFKGSRKSTAFAATLVGQDAARQAIARGIHEVEVRVQGAGSGRESAIRALQSAGLKITVIKDVTPIPHNGCRARKRRRV